MKDVKKSSQKTSVHCCSLSPKQLFYAISFYAKLSNINNQAITVKCDMSPECHHKK